MKIPVYESRGSLQPTPVNPSTAAQVGREIVDVSQGLEAIGGKIKEMNDTRQTIKANIALSKIDDQAWMMAASDNDLDKVEEKIKNHYDREIQSVASGIDSPDARNAFVAEASLDSARKQGQLKRHIYTRQSDQLKEAVTINNDHLVDQYKRSQDKNERMLLKKKSYEMTEDAVRKGFIHGNVAKEHLESLWHDADIEQVKSDASLDAEATLQRLQEGKSGLYSNLTDAERKQLFTTVEKQVKKEGIENNYIREIAQNHTETTIMDKMASHSLTMQDISNARLGVGMPPARPEFIKAAQEALEDPFPTGTSDEQYLKAVDVVGNDSISPEKARVAILKTRGLTPQQKAHLTNWAIREDDSGKKRSLNQLISDGVKQNKQELMERNLEVQKQIQSKRGIIQGVKDLFTNHIKEEADRSKSFQSFFEKLNEVKKSDQAMGIAHDVLKQSVLEKYPEVAGFKEVPSLVYSEDEEVYSIFPADPKVKVYPSKVYDSKTKSLVDNPNREISN